MTIETMQRQDDNAAHFEPIDFKDQRNAFVYDRCRGKDVLDLGSVMHDPANYRSRYWLFRGLDAVANSLIGLDYDAQGVAYLRERGYNLVVGDAQDFSLDQSFDVIVAGELIEHLANPGGLIECARRHLRPGGSFIISTPNPWWWKNVALATLSREIRNNPEHVSWFCIRTLRQLFARYDMRIVAFEHASRSGADRWLPLPAGIRCPTLVAEMAAS